MPAGLRERKKARQRQQIVDVAVELFRERGYEKTTVEEIVRRVEISQPTFYKYFRSKDAVLRHVAGDVLRGWSVGVEKERGADGEPVADALQRLYRRLAHMMTHDRPLWHCIVLADALNPLRFPEQQPAEIEAERGLVAIVSRGQQRGELRDDLPARHLVEKLVSMQLMSCFAWAANQLEGRSLRAVLRENLEFFLRAASAR